MHYTQQLQQNKRTLLCYWSSTDTQTWLNRPTRLISCCVFSQFLGALAQLRKATISFVMSARQSVCLSVCLSFCLSVCLSVCLPVYLSVRSHGPAWLQLDDLHHSFRARLSQWYWWTFKSSRMLRRLVYGYRLFQAAQSVHLAVQIWLFNNFLCFADRTSQYNISN